MPQPPPPDLPVLGGPLPTRTGGGAGSVLLRVVAPLLGMQRLPYALLVPIRPGRRLRHFRELTARRVTASLLPY